MGSQRRAPLGLKKVPEEIKKMLDKAQNLCYNKVTKGEGRYGKASRVQLGTKGWAPTRVSKTY